MEMASVMFAILGLSMLILMPLVRITEHHGQMLTPIFRMRWISLTRAIKYGWPQELTHLLSKPILLIHAPLLSK